MTDTLRRALTGTTDQPTLIFERHYAFPATDLWAALTEVERLQRWFGTFTGPVPRGVGDRFEVSLGGGPDDVATGRVTACDPGRHLAYEWQWQTETPSTVEVELLPEGQECVLRLEHTLGERTNVVGYGGGWEQVLLSLEDLLRGTPSPDDAHRSAEEAGNRAWRALQEAAQGEGQAS